MKNPDPFQVGSEMLALRGKGTRQAGRILRRFWRRLLGTSTSSLLPLQEVKTRLRLFNSTYLGVRVIPVAKIVGTVSRSKDFDRDFRPQFDHVEERLDQFARAFPQGGFPPITVNKLGDAYFVIDGHHRVAVAKRLRMDYIEAEVSEFQVPFELRSDIDIGHIIYLEQQRLFMEYSGLDRARPEAHIGLSRPHAYWDMLDVIRAHGFELMLQRRELLTREQIAADWYDRIYLPAVEAMREEGLQDAFPDATIADLFVWVRERRRVLFPERGSVELREVARQMAFERSRSHTRGKGGTRPRSREVRGRPRRPVRTR